MDENLDGLSPRDVAHRGVGNLGLFVDVKGLDFWKSADSVKNIIKRMVILLNGVFWAVRVRTSKKP